MILQRLNNTHLMFCAKCLKCNTQLHCRIAVGGNKLVMLQLDDIALLLGDDACHTYQFTWTDPEEGQIP